MSGEVDRAAQDWVEDEGEVEEEDSENCLAIEGEVDEAVEEGRSLEKGFEDGNDMVAEE